MRHIRTYSKNAYTLHGQISGNRPNPQLSNAWDADATKVDIRLPLDEAWDPANADQFITVSDNGNGMTWDMVRDAYLNVGRDRRRAERTDKSPDGRRLQGRKGIGKLAGFGIADTLEVQTVYKAKDPRLKERVLIWFQLDLSDLTKVEDGPAPVNVIFAGPITRAPKGTRITKGTTVVLRQLHERKARNADRFHHSMAQRFLLLPRFRVLIKVGAEWLDAGVEAPDHIATPRDSIAWESPEGVALKEWGQQLLKRSLSEWAKFRASLREKQITEVSPQVQARIEKLAPAYKDVALPFVEKFKIALTNRWLARLSALGIRIDDRNGDGNSAVVG